MKIDNIKVKRILDSRGEETIEVILESEGIKEKASVPMGKSVGKHEAVCLDCEKIEKNLDEFKRLIKDKDFTNFVDFDNFLIEISGKNKERFGANFVLGCSIAFARLLAKKEGKELWEYLKTNNQIENLGFMVNIIGGGVHSFNNLDFQEYWLVIKNNSQKSINDVIAFLLSVINYLEEKLPKPLGRNDEGAFSTNFSDNYEPFLYLKDCIEKNFRQNISLGVDIAANQINKNFNWNEVYQKLKNLNVEYLEDPYKEDEFENFANLRKEFGFKVIGDDLTVTNIERLKIALEKEAVDGVIVKPNQIGTIFETLKFTEMAKENNLFTIFSHRSGETNDDWIIDLGIAFNTDFFKIGPVLQGERVAKWNRLKEILG